MDDEVTIQSEPWQFVKTPTYRCMYGHEQEGSGLQFVLASGITYNPCLHCLIDKLKELGIPEVKEVDGR